MCLIWDSQIVDADGDPAEVTMSLCSDELRSTSTAPDDGLPVRMVRFFLDDRNEIPVHNSIYRGYVRRIAVEFGVGNQEDNAVGVITVT